jgi:hypothetical protein
MIQYAFYTNFEQISYDNKKYGGFSIYKVICYWQPLIDFTISYLFYTKKICEKT